MEALLSEQLAHVIRTFDLATSRLYAVARSVTLEQAGTRPFAERWSAAEHLAHLNLTSEAFLPGIEAGIDQARRLGGHAGRRYRRDLVGALLSMIVGPQWRIGRKRLLGVRTPPAFVPQATAPFDQLLADFDRLQRRLVELVKSGDGLPLDSVRVVSPFDARVRYNLYSAFVIIPRHQLRHIVHMEDDLSTAADGRV